MLMNTTIPTVEIRHRGHSLVRSLVRRGTRLLLALGLGSLMARAHFPILIHDAELGATNGVVTVTYAVGHPFELEMEPADRPGQVMLLGPRGQRTNLTASLQPINFRGQEKMTAWQVRFEPASGDSLIALDTPPTVDEGQKSLYREYVKVCVHRNTQDGWTRRSGQPLEIVPLTRPYGLLPGMVFSGRLLRGEQPVADTEVYFERLNEQVPAAGRLPAEPLVTFAVRTDRDGQFVLSLPDAGWWVIGAYADDLGTMKHAGKDYRHEGFAGLWLKVDTR
jgi:cobalt/nickel transport protein